MHVGGDGLSVSERTAADVFAAILTRGPLSRRDIAGLTGLSLATITKAVKPMLAAGYVVEEREQAQGPGRPVLPLRVNPDGRYVLGVKVAPHQLIGVVANAQAEVLASARRPLPAREPGIVVAEIAAIYRELLERRPEVAPRLAGIGLALGGHVDGRLGVLRYAPLLGWRDVPLAELVEAATGVKTVIENDVNALAVVEQLFGAGSGLASFAVVTVGAGVGCGLVVHGELVHGATGMAGELGHVVIDADGDMCPCGNRGCLETVAADTAILAAIAADGGPFLTSVGEAALLAREGNEAARHAFERAGEGLGRALSIIANVVNPARIVLSGEGVVASDLMVDRVQDELERHVFSKPAGMPELVTRPLSDETWARGAAALVLRDTLLAAGRGRRAKVVA